MTATSLYWLYTLFLIHDVIIMACVRWRSWRVYGEIAKQGCGRDNNLNRASNRDKESKHTITVCRSSCLSHLTDHLYYNWSLGQDHGTHGFPSLRINVIQLLLWLLRGVRYLPSQCFFAIVLCSENCDSTCSSCWRDDPLVLSLTHYNEHFYLKIVLVPVWSVKVRN